MKSSVILALCLAGMLFQSRLVQAESPPRSGTRIALVLAAGGSRAPTPKIPPQIAPKFEPGTMFDAALASMARTFAAFDERWVFCGMEHPITARLCQALAKGAPAADFIGDEVVKVANALARRIDEDRSIVQLVIAIETHGSPEGGGTPRHPIWAAGGTFDLNRLEPLIAAAKRRQLALAIIDNSCFGGSSLSDAEDGGACVITQGARRTVAFENVAPRADGRLNSLWNQLGPGISLEQAALHVRSATGDKSETLWQIGTPAGLQIYRELETAVERVQFFPDQPTRPGEPKPKFEPLEDPQLQWIFAGFGSGHPRPGSPEYLDALGKSWASLTGGRATSAQRELLKLVGMAESFYEAWETTWRRLLEVQSAQVYVSSRNMTVLKPLLWLLTASDKELRQCSPGDANVAAAQAERQREPGMSYYKNLAALAADLPKISEWRESPGGPTLRERIRAAERKVYAELYAAATREHSQDPNPCSRFFL